MADFLLEIGLEEIPARMIVPAEAELARRVTALIERERLAKNPEVKSFSTPRRIAVLVSGVYTKQEDVTEEIIGPSAKIAYKDGKPSPAAEAFSRKTGIDVAALKTITTPKGEYLAATVKRAGRAAVDVLRDGLTTEISAIYWAKSMYWRAGKPERFVRPVRWMVAMLDDVVVPVEFAGFTAGNATQGHRILHGGNVVNLAVPRGYLVALHGAFVVADVAERRENIRKALDAATRTIPGARWREDEALVDTVTNLTEWPTVVLGSFEPEYLTLPEEVLVTVMRDHQKYFAVEDAQGKLLPKFLAVLNTQADEAGQAVIRHGNERVLRARFNDARFFWEFDQKIPLAERVEMLKTVTFQKNLGSYAAKSETVCELVEKLGALLPKGVADVAAAAEAARLSKTDLTTELVKEFTELQGIVGGLYARAQGLSAKTADAIYAQYQPAAVTDAIPATAEGQLLGVADRANTIVDMFAIGLQPTGSKDPFALRRAANGVVKILAEGALPLTVEQVITAAAGVSKQKGASADAVKTFFAERVEFYLREVKGQAYDVVKAVLAGGADDVRDAVARAEAVTLVRESADFAAVSAAFKRMKNILAQAAEKKDAPAASVDAKLLTDAAEVALAKDAAALAVKVEALRQKRQYAEALAASASLRPAVDAFFEAVMVMAPEAAVRANRLALLKKLLDDFSKIADFSEIVVSN
jgi:glycyl-tRNA synthetase beta chain